jgi:hypothetical protein
VRRAWLVMAVALLLYSGERCGHAKELVLMFDFPHDVTADSFLVTYRAASDPGGVLQQFRIPWMPAPTCATVDPAAPPDTFCALTPPCLPPGIYTLSVQAEYGDVTSDPTNWTSCEALTGCGYDCAKFADANAALNPPADGTSPPSPSSAPAAPVQTAPVQATPSSTPTLQQLEAAWRALDRLTQQPVIPLPTSAAT